tara:strand:+ start:1346 stop:1837 length:492 start_codon:yes stop_codon:yes gene_type:complete
MIIKLKNKEKLIINDFIFRCSIGLKGLNKSKIEGDKSTPSGNFNLGNLYYRADRVKKPKTNLKCIKIEKNMGWCNDSKSKHYNKQINITKKIKAEKLYRKDYKYNLFINIKYNSNKIKPFKGSAIFIHLTNNYKPTAGCIALKKKDFLIVAKLLTKNSRIFIS